MILRRILYVILIGITFVISILYSQYSAHLAFVLVCTIPAVFFTILLINTFLIKFDTKVQTSFIQKGDNIRINVELKNKSFLPTGDVIAKYNVSYGNMKMKTSKICIAALPFSKEKSYFEIPAQYCGIITITVNSAKMLDYGKLFSLPVKIDKKQKNILVIPKAFPLEIDYNAAISNELDEVENYHQSKKGNDKTEIFNVREYNEGDQIKDIHWKMSSRLDKYMIKEYSLPLCKNIDLLINTSINMNSIEQCQVMDKIIEIFYSIGTNLVVAEIGFNVYAINTVFNSYVNTTVDKDEELYLATSQIMEMNVDNAYEGKITEAQLFEEAKKNNIIYITSDITKELVNTLSSYTEKKITIIFITNKNGQELGLLLQTVPPNIKIITVGANVEEMGGVYEIKL